MVSAQNPLILMLPRLRWPKRIALLTLSRPLQYCLHRVPGTLSSYSVSNFQMVRGTTLSTTSSMAIMMLTGQAMLISSKALLG